MARLATVLVEKLFDALRLFDLAELLVKLLLFVLVLSEEAENCEALLAEADSASCEALVEAALAAKLFDLEAFADRLLFAAKFALPVSEAALFPEVVSVLALLELPLDADELPWAKVLLDAVPPDVEVAPLLAELLLRSEPPDVPELPPTPELAAFDVVPLPDVLLVACALLADAVIVPAADVEPVAVNEPLDAKLSETAADLLEFLEAEADSISLELLAALTCCELLFVSIALMEVLWLDALSSVSDWSWVVWVFSAPLRVKESELLFVTSELALTDSWLFAPREYFERLATDELDWVMSFS
jgi:hypothetical protein